MTEKPRPSEQELSNLPFYGCRGNVVSLTQFFQRYGTECVDYINRSGWNALMWAAAEGRKEAVQYLLEQGANVDLKGEDGMTAEMAARKYQRHDIADLLKVKSEERSFALKQKEIAEKQAEKLADQRMKKMKTKKALSPFRRS